MELSATLSALGLQRYYDRFVEHDLDLAMLRHLGTTPNTLRGVLTELGVSILGHREKLVNALSRPAAPAPAADEPRAAATSPAAAGSQAAAGSPAASPAASPATSVMAPASKKFKRDAPKLAVGEGPLYKLFKPRFSGEPEKLAAEIQRAAIVEHTASLREEKADGELRALAQAKAAAAGEQVLDYEVLVKQRKGMAAAHAVVKRTSAAKRSLPRAVEAARHQEPQRFMDGRRLWRTSQPGGAQPAAGRHGGGDRCRGRAG